MMIVVVLGGCLAIVVSNSDSPVLRATFAYIGSHLLFAGLFLVLTAALMVAINKDEQEPKHPLVLSSLLIVIMPAVCSGVVLSRIVLPALDGSVAKIAIILGALGTPFLVLGVGGSILELISARRGPGSDKR